MFFFSQNTQSQSSISIPIPYSYILCFCSNKCHNSGNLLVTSAIFLFEIRIQMQRANSTKNINGNDCVWESVFNNNCLPNRTMATYKNAEASIESWVAIKENMYITNVFSLEHKSPLYSAWPSLTSTEFKKKKNARNENQIKFNSSVALKFKYYVHVVHCVYLRNFIINAIFNYLFFRFPIKTKRGPMMFNSIDLRMDFHPFHIQIIRT